jgi:hypothetical protein
MSKRLFKLDERGNRTVSQISTILYVITLYSLTGFQLYRQFVLKQPSEEWNDIAILISFNVIVWLGSLLYLSGVVDPKVIRLRTLIAGFTGFVILGSAFTIFKYSVLLDQALSMRQILDCIFMVVKISALLAVCLGLLAYFGTRRIEKQIR